MNKIKLKLIGWAIRLQYATLDQLNYVIKRWLHNLLMDALDVEVGNTDSQGNPDMR